MSTFTVRPSNSEKEIGRKNAFRINLTAVSLLSLKLKPGDLVLLQLSHHDATASCPAIAWENSGGGMKDNIVQTSKFLQDFHGFKLGDKVGIVRSSVPLKDATNVLLKPLSSAALEGRLELWRGVLWGTVHASYDVLAKGQKISVRSGKREAEFEVLDVGGLLSRITTDTDFSFSASNISAKAGLGSGLTLDFGRVGGLQQQIQQVKDQVKFLVDPAIKTFFPYLQGQHGLLLYGAKGTGKTVLQKDLAESGWASVTRWTPGVKPSVASYPQLIMADLWDMTGSSKAVSELLNVFRDIEGTPTLVVGEARHPNDVSERLRASEAFSVELELPVPDSDQRLDILRKLRGDATEPSDDQISGLATRTHGYVGADLNHLLQQIARTAYKRHTSTMVEPEFHHVSSTTTGKQVQGGQSYSESYSNEQDSSSALPPPYEAEQSQPQPLRCAIIQADIEQALTSIRPSALQQVFLEKPSVRWTDIGGQHALKRRLTSAVERTLSKPLRERMARLGLEATKGVLLYGPPGCSKTLLAKALATEADLNFLAVKGAELISMYVGESERATRDVFRKARAAAPSILFFDEIDAIASRGGSGASRGGGGSSDLNVLTTLLNEMDGFEELRNVIVVAATNKPQSIDPALLRPGRFDNVVYVGLPDVETRREIFEKRFRGVELDEAARGMMGTFAAQTEGYSGAEVVAICKAAGESALDAERDCVMYEDVQRAIGAAPRGISAAMLAEYEGWNASRGASE